MTAETLTMSFRAKVADLIDAREDFLTREARPGYRVPVLQSHHVATPRPQQGARHALLLSNRDKAILERQMRGFMERAGLDGRNVFPGDPGVIIVPIGNGFMAQVTLTIPLTKA